MDTTLLKRFRETILQRAQNISGFLQNTPPSTLKLRIGPASEMAVAEELALLNNTIKKADDHTLGKCEVCDGYIESVRLEMDYTACVCIEHLSREERSKLENDLELSAKVQQALLPQTLPRIRAVDIAAYSQPARIVGGDYFDFLKFKDGSHAIIIADVMGKGMPASMLMASLQASLRIIAPESNEPSEVVARLNSLFCHNIRLTNFVTLFLAKFNEETRIFSYCNAGHNPPLLRKSDGTIETLEPTGAAIGLIEQTSFDQRSVSLNSGDQLLMYTDGVVESFDPQRTMFGQERLEEFLRFSGKKSAHQLIGDLKKSLQTFTGSTTPADDTTIIAMNVK
ncbi:MAG: SpoIIE family protein phosphatase [Ignavibacteriales bacterium]|nr:SpoIIE family protein phosphatase [Ignavibacteriales bacterium]